MILSYKLYTIGLWRSCKVMSENLADSAEAPRSTCTQVSVGMNASARAIPPDCNPTSDALGKRSGG
jgi:hypothetical protein